MTAFSGLCPEAPEAVARRAGFDHFPTKPTDPLAIAALSRRPPRQAWPNAPPHVGGTAGVVARHFSRPPG